MILALPIDGSLVNQHFGKSKSFVIVTIEEKAVQKVMEVSAVEFAHQHESLADLLVKNGATVVITGGIGQGAIQGLKAKGLDLITGASGEYMDVVKSYIEGTLVDKNVSCNHHGEDHKH